MTEVVWHAGAVSAESRIATTGGRGVTVWLTGLSGSGKATIAYGFEIRLVTNGRAAYVLGGDSVRHGLNADLGISPEERTENVRRVGEVARLMADVGIVVAVPVISPYRADRMRARAAHDAAGIPFYEVWVSTPLAVCEARDPKGLYARARTGALSSFTGIYAPYEALAHPDLALDTASVDVAGCVNSILELIG